MNINHWKTHSDTDSKRRGIIIGCAVLAVLAVIAIVSVIHRKNADAVRQSEAESVSIAESIAAEESAMAEEEADSLTESEDEALTALVKDYFRARLSADTTRIYEIFGRTDTSPSETFADKLKAQASWIQGYQDIKLYTMPGTEEDEAFCLVTYNIDFRRTDTLAPGIMYFFAKTLEDGSIVIEENLLKDKVDYAEEVMQGGAASALIDDTDAALKSAADSDSTLALIYTSFLNGEIYEESDIDISADQDVDIFMDPEDSVLVDSEVLKNIADEAAEAASIEASEGAGDVYETDAEDEAAEDAGNDAAGGDAEINIDMSADSLEGTASGDESDVVIETGED